MIVPHPSITDSTRKPSAFLVLWLEALVLALVCISCLGSKSVQSIGSARSDYKGEDPPASIAPRGILNVPRDTIVLSGEQTSGRFTLPDSLLTPLPSRLFIPVLRLEKSTGFSVIVSLSKSGSKQEVPAGRFTPLQPGTYTVGTVEPFSRLREIASDSLRARGVELILHLEPIHEVAPTDSMSATIGAPRR